MRSHIFDFVSYFRLRPSSEGGRMNDAELNRIQADTFRQIERLCDTPQDAKALGVATLLLVSDAQAKVRRRNDRIVDALNLVASTRWRRLQQTQFVYWPLRGGHPRIENKNGTHSYLQEQVEQRCLDARDLPEALAALEHELFAAIAEDEVTVFWRGWSVLPSDKLNHVTVSCNYCVSYTWETGVISDQPSATPPRPKGWVLNELPSKWKSGNKLNPTTESTK